MLYVEGNLLKKSMRAQIKRTKTTVLAVTFRVPMPSVSQYLNPHTAGLRIRKSLMSLIKHLRLEILSIATNCMPEVVSDLPYDVAAPKILSGILRD